MMMNAELVAIMGPSGVGKSTYARLHYPDHIQLDPDPLIRALFADYRLVWYPHMHAASKRMQAAALAYLLPRGHNVVMIYDGQTRKKRHKLVELAAKYGANLYLIRLVAPPETCAIRAQSDATRPKSSKKEWPRIVQNWFLQFESVDSVAECFSYQEVNW